MSIERRVWLLVWRSSSGLSDETARIVALPDTREPFLKQGANPSSAGSAAFGQLHKHEYARLNKVVPESKITPQ